MGDAEEVEAAEEAEWQAEAAAAEALVETTLELLRVPSLLRALLKRQHEV